jgi:hypothetical protein
LWEIPTADAGGNLQLNRLPSRTYCLFYVNLGNMAAVFVRARVLCHLLILCAI